MINAVHSEATVNSKGRETKIIKLHRQTDRCTHNNKHGESYNSNYSVHKWHGIDMITSNQGRNCVS